MKTKLAIYVSFILLMASLAAAQIPCGPTIMPKATLFTNWPQYRFDAAHTGCNPYETVLSTTTVGGLVLDWTSPVENHPYGDPVVGNGAIYFTSGKVLHALNAVTGTPLWKYDAGIVDLSAPVVVNGVVYVGADLENAEKGAVYAFSATNGSLLWQYTTVRMVVSAPVIVNGVLYVGDRGGTLYAIDAGTGAFLWLYRTGTGDNEIQEPPAVANGVIYFSSTYPIHPNYSTTLYALNTATRQVIWQYTWNDSINSVPVAGSNSVYFNSTVFDANTGAIKWQPAAPFFSTPALANGVLYVGSFDGNFYALNATTGAVKWHYKPGGDIYVSPAIANGVVYEESTNGNLYALNAATGAVLWQYAVSSYGASGPAIANGRVYIGSQDNNLYAFHLPGQ